MSVMERTQNKKSIWASLKEVFWDCDNIGEETLLKGNTPEITAELLKSQANVDKRYADLSSSNGNSAKGGKGNSTRKQVVNKVKVEPLKNVNVNEKSTKKVDREEIGER